MIKAIGVIFVSAAVVAFLSGSGMAKGTSPEHPTTTEHPKAAPTEPEHPKAAPKEPEHPKAEPKEPEHPKAEEKKPDHPN